ncbi:unnamed protein product [Durusdinium trenchii]|uniref:Methyltransferase domain-containing protein n=1 Tax=Durusdinium trenchii TaxID=1381693 RepID=A0ABP0MT22_9DINO
MESGAQRVTGARCRVCCTARLRFQWRPNRSGVRRDGRIERAAVEACAVEWLKEATTAASNQLQITEKSTASFLVVQDLLRRLNGTSETEMQILCSLLTLEELCKLEEDLRQNAINKFEAIKFDFAKTHDRNALRADLLRPSFGSVTCSEISEAMARCFISGGSLARTLAALAGCNEEDAVSLLRFARRLSNLFAPIEFTKQVARQDWERFPFAFGAYLLPAVDLAVRSLRDSGTPSPPETRVKVSVFGATGCLAAALSSRLGCQTSLAEPSELLRSCLESLFHSNAVACTVGEDADASADLFVLSLDEDGLFEWGHLRVLKEHLKRRREVAQRLGIKVEPKVLPEVLCIKAALIDDTLPRIRGCRLNRFEKMRGDLAISHRWPRGACHIRPQMRSPPQLIYESSILSLAENADKSYVSFFPEPGMPVNGIAVWVQFRGLPEDNSICCIQPLPVRRAELGFALHLWAHFSDVKVWFEWADSGPGQLTTPPLGKTKLPPWHFKMLNDHERNRRYHMAIARAISRKQAKGGTRVLDCGCGAGLLSLLASREGASRVTAVELSPLISDLTKEIVKDQNHQIQDHFSILAADVRQLSPEQVGEHDIIVSELMDASGLGESLLSVLQHACHHLSAPGAQVIPCGIRLVGALGWHRLPNCHDAFDFSALNALYFCSQLGGPFSQKEPPPCLHGGTDLPSLHSGPFTSRNLNRLRRHEVWDLLSPEQTLLTVNFSKALEGASLYPCTNKVTLQVSQDGVANCLIWWWEVQLDECETLSNRPKALGGCYETHWHQPLLPFGPLPVTIGDELLLKVSISDSAGQKLNFTLEPAKPRSATAWIQPALLPEDPLMKLLVNWRKDLEEACAENTALTSKFTSRGDLDGLQRLQKAVLILCLMPQAFGCGPFVRDRLLQSYFGVAYK